MGYLVFFRCPPQSARTKRREFKLEGGVYIYVGSCGNLCLRRVERHLARPANKHWHVDYLNCEPLFAVVTAVDERELALCLAQRCKYVEGFGSTDDPAAPSHLFQCQPGDALICA